MTKTGSTSLQHFLRLNREVLAAGGWLYPRSPGRARHIRLGFMAKSDEELARTSAWVLGDHPDPAVFRRRFPRRLAAEVADSGLTRTILSDEFLWEAHHPERLNDLIGPFTGRVRLVAYLRRQDDHLVSSYQQKVRGGGIARLAGFARQRAAWPVHDYPARLEAWRRAVQPEDVVVRRFEPARFAGGSLYEDFLGAAGVDVGVDHFILPPRRNESLDAESVEVLRILNLHRVENEGLTPGRIDNGPLLRRLEGRVDAGPTLTLPEAVLDRIMDRWSPSNRAVAREYLDEPDGDLFTAPRKDAGTTADQRLDPARLDHFLELLEIPEVHRRDLRRIAEREASRP